MSEIFTDGTVGEEAQPAATVVPLRDGPDGIEVLMLRRNATGSFAGHWVFPGGRIDAGDTDPNAPGDELAAARRAAVREAREEAALDFDPEALVTYSYWCPPPETRRRFNTWFFLAPAPAASTITVDGAEIHEHAWLRPGDAIARRDKGEVELAPPTWVTLSELAAAGTMGDAITAAAEREPSRYSTHIARSGKLIVATWAGDAAYEDGDLDRPGGRHRLAMDPNGWRFERSDHRAG